MTRVEKLSQRLGDWNETDAENEDCEKAEE